ncbi:MAG TPA: ribonuclease PH [Acidimicrobiales bacterium]|nr:ribonuclease PH [Acidimicrobiales bacterium]
MTDGGYGSAGSESRSGSDLRADGRRADELRPVELARDFTEFAPGSVLVKMGRTVVLCTASFAEEVPRWLRGTGRGWVSAEYSMLPGSSPERVEREATRGRQSGRTQEIQRLIGRSLRAVTDLEVLADQHVTLDCDVLQADGGTRTASIVGAWIALHDACNRMLTNGRLKSHPVREGCAAVSVGIVDGRPTLDLCYSEDAGAEVDMNVVMTSSGRLVEVQGTAEGAPFSKENLQEMLVLAEGGIASLLAAQADVVATPPAPRPPRGSPARG